MELRGGLMAGHSRRVGELARRLGQECGLDERACDELFLAGLLHDIGKIGLSDTVLSRPVSTLTGAHMTEYRRHAANSEAALMPLEELREAARLIRSHHEQYSGQGFPDGLQGTNIPLGSRILAIVNDYDGFQLGTLTERQLSGEQALAMLRQFASKRYDPQLVEVFAALLEKIHVAHSGERLVAAAQLTSGMVLMRDLVGDNGTLLLAAEYRLTPHIVSQLQQMAARSGKELMLPIRVEP